MQGHVTDAEDCRLPIPRIVHGSILSRSPLQTFARTQFPLPDGMCGGPVLIETDNPKQGPLVSGIVEGIVPLDFKVESYRGAAVYVESPEIKV